MTNKPLRMTHSEEPRSGRPAEHLGCRPLAQVGLVPFFPPPSPDTTTSEKPSEEAPERASRGGKQHREVRG